MLNTKTFQEDLSRFDTITSPTVREHIPNLLGENAHSTRTSVHSDHAAIFRLSIETRCSSIEDHWVNWQKLGENPMFREKHPISIG